MTGLTCSCFVCGAPAPPPKYDDCPRAYCEACTAAVKADLRRGYALLTGQSEPLVVVR